MVWKETCKFGIHTGRTLRKPWKPLEPVSSGDRGFLTKTVANTNINFTDKDISRYLKKFHVQDGLDDEEVANINRRSRAFQWKVLRRRLIEIGVRVPSHYSTMKIKVSCISRLSFFLDDRLFYYDVVLFLLTKRVFTRLHSFEQVKTLRALRER